ncbi:MAG: hypothetical protein CVU39_25960 [Chloroflexi bacterium HGW-Chloroflexi-10]|nr:MAG: hypothetical protein CVU39_25960 [Chloroflexi bacterium HGW-Chloroflexi-10]
MRSGKREPMTNHRRQLSAPFLLSQPPTRFTPRTHPQVAAQPAAHHPSLFFPASFFIIPSPFDPEHSLFVPKRIFSKKHNICPLSERHPHIHGSFPEKSFVPLGIFHLDGRMNEYPEAA